MLSLIRIALPSDSKVLIEEGEQISENSPLYKSNDEKILYEIPLAKLLKIKPERIVRFLRRKIGESVAKGDILAEKKGWLSSLSVRSPFDGEIKELDVKKGLLLLSHKKKQPEIKISLPIAGKVKKITASHIEIEVKATSIEGRKGAGKEQMGKLLYISDERFHPADFDAEVEGRIVFLKKAPREVIAKLDVLGAKGLISTELPDSIDFSALEVEREAAVKLIKEADKTVWLKPLENLLIITESL